MNWENLRSCDQSARQHIDDGNYRDALEVLVLGYQKIIIGFCTNMLGDQTQAEEVAQEVFLATFQAMPRYRQDASVRTWLFAIARKCCYKFIRSRRQRGRIQRQRQALIAERSHRDPPLSPENDPEIPLQEIRQALQKLNKSDRSLLLMRYDSGLQITDLAHILGISVASVRRHLAQALDHLREVVNDDIR